MGFPYGLAGKESAFNAGDLGSIPGLGRSPGRRERLPTPGFWPGEFHELYSPWGCKELDTTEQLSLHFKLSFKHLHFLPWTPYSNFHFEWGNSWTRLSNFHFTLEKIFKCWQGLETNQEELRLTVPAVYTDTSPSNKSLVKQSPLQLKSHIPSTWQSYSAGIYSRAGLVKRAHQPSKRQGTFPPSLSIRNVK